MGEKGTRAFAAISLLLLLAALIGSALVKVKAFGALGVLTQHNDNGRSGANLNETILNTSNVNVAHFGKLFSRQVDGFIYAQPLYVPNLTIPGSGSHNVVFVATEHNSVYGFDADDPNAQSALWQVNLGTSMPSTDVNPSYLDLIPEIGITSTPVIDTGTNTIYVVAKTKNLADSSYHQKLHALDISTGAEKAGSPVEIAASVPATGGGSITFNPYLQLNRPGLLLLNGVVYLAFGSQGDNGAYHGWVLGYSASTLQQVSVFNTTPDAVQGAVWHGGGGLASDGSNIYLSTGNGTFDLDHGGRDYGDSVLKLGAGALTVGDWFTPWNQSGLNMTDSDLGSGGPMLLPGTNLLVVCGKDGLLRLINTSSMGHFDPAVNHDVQEFQAVPVRFFGSPIYWNSPGGPQIYMWGTEDVLKVFSLAGGVFNTTPVSQSTMAVTSGYSNSVPLSLSASGSQSGSGIVWACAPFIGDSNRSTVPGIVRAFDAGNVGVELWNSMQNQGRDDIGNYAKFCPPTISNGKVYVATFSGKLQVYGLLAATNYAGTLEHAGCDTISGWAADRNRLNTSINVSVYDGTNLLTTVLANDFRSDIGQLLGDNGLHGFSIATPPLLKDGNAHTIHVQFETNQTELTNSPAGLTCIPSYVGFADHIGCDTIVGWAADRNRLNASINVEIYDGATLVTTVLANVSRPDVRAFLGDNGLHGFNVVTPPTLKNGAPHSVHVKFEAGTTELTNSSANLTCAGTPVYIGYVDHLGCDTIQGWAADRNRLNTSINVEIYDGTTLLATALANGARPDVGAFLGDNGLHGFSMATPAAIKDGASHTVHVKFETSATDLTSSPVTQICVTTNYIGYLDHVGCDLVSGWVADRNRPNTSINVEIYDGSTLLVTVLANASRPDVGAFLGDNGLHGFSIATPPALKDGSLHSAHVRFETSPTELTNSPANLQCTDGTVYIGYVDHLECDTIQGWAADRNRPNTSINVEIYDGSTLLVTVPANVSRPDVGTFLGDNGLHGFSTPFPATLKDGQAHSIHVKFETSTAELSNSPATLTCP
jgi:hypothetical protein